MSIWQVEVDSIILDDGEIKLDESWSNDEDDEKADNMVQLINDDFQFNKKMFTCGFTRANVTKLKKKKS